MKHIHLYKYVFLFSIGGISSLAMAPTNISATLFIGLSALYILLNQASTYRSAALTGFMFSLGYFGFGLSWIGNALLVEDNAYWWAWPLAVSGLPIILSCFTATVSLIYKKLCGTRNNALTFGAFVILMTASEYARGTLFTGFPWNLYGYTWIEYPEITQIASLYNVYLLSALTIFWAALPGFLYALKSNTKQRILFAIIGTLSLIGSYLYGSTLTKETHPTATNDYDFTIVQPNIKQSDKWRPEKRTENFMQKIKLSNFNPNKHRMDAKAYYIIWPETAISQGVLSTPWAIQAIKDTLHAYPQNAYLITGIQRHESATQSYYNSLIIMNKDAQVIHTYDKTHLVPFGEYMPLKGIIDIAPIVGFTGFQKGENNKPYETENGLTVASLICYEIIFPNKAPPADLIINITNDAWYGDSAGPYQHLVQTQFRAIEQRTPIIRAANTGVSAFISWNGQVINKLDFYNKGRIIEKTGISIAKPN